MKQKKNFCRAAALLAAFLLWTAAVCAVDVQPIGPQGSPVGLAAVNRFFHTLTGVHMALYTATDRLSLVPLGFVAGFALLGLCQWVRRKRLLLVDRDILLLGGFYALVLAVYAFFEVVPVNYRPVLIGGIAEVSYPSSTTMLVLCVVQTAVMQLKRRIQNNRCRRILCAALTAFGGLMVAGRAVSGVHWFSDIVGGILLGSGLVRLYGALSDFE